MPVAEAGVTRDWRALAALERLGELRSRSVQTNHESLRRKDMTMSFKELSMMSREPVKVEVADDDAEVLKFAADAFRQGGAALATLVEIRGGAARAIGSHVAIAADGRFCGCVSGGCVEAVVAAEALLAIAEGKDRLIELGAGSRFFDIALPCGGGITIAIHVLRGVSQIQHVVHALAHRSPVALRYSSRDASLSVVSPPRRTSWGNGELVRVYRPTTRLLISGNGMEARAVKAIADAAGFNVLWKPERNFDFAEATDAHSAIVLLHHDIEKEIPIFEAVLHSNAFYIGALGSERTHRERTRRLVMTGMAPHQISRIKAPIGIFGPARDANSLALSIVADVAAARLTLVP